MAALVVNIALILAVVVLVATCAVGGIRRRRQHRRQHAEQGTLILQAFLGAAAMSPGTPPAPSGDPAPTGQPAAPQLDAASVAALLDMLEDRRTARRGLFAGLVNGPHTIWAAADQAGQSVGRRTMGQTPAGEQVGPELIRAAAAELIHIHAHDPHAAQLEYRRYADAAGDPALAALYVRSAANSTHAEHDHLRKVVEQITGAAQPPEASDDAATIDT
jgi:hypothetical protein